MARHIVRIIAWGNRGRRDDGVGLALAERLEYQLADRPEIVVQQYHQLGPELVYDLNDCDLAIFIDAHTCEDRQDVTLDVLEPADTPCLNTHHCKPAELLALAAALELQLPEALQVCVRAYDLSFGDELSPRTRKALVVAEELVLSLVNAHAVDAGEVVCDA
jgi:hydrogenase maturation protease